MAKTAEKTSELANEEKSYPIGLGFCSVSADANSSVVDVKNGKIIRIRPLHYDWKYKPQEFNPWKIKARGKVFEPKMKALIPPYSLSYKKRVYSPNRILYPLKRIDWDPNGERNPQNRGKSGYVRISWDEALDIIVSELKRIQKTYGPYAVFSESDGHAETAVVHTPHGTSRRLLELMGGYTLQTRNPDSWEGWYWGAKHVWGMEPVGEMWPVTNIIPDILKNGEMVLFWGCDPETTPWGFNGQMASLVCYWYNELSIKSIYVCPDLNYGAAVHADKWIPILPDTDAAMHLAIAYIWIVEGTYDKDYVATHTYGFDKFEEYVLGIEDGVAKTPKWAEGKCGVPSRIIKALARAWSAKKTSTAHGNGGSMIRGPYATEPARLEVLLLAMQGLGSPGRHFYKMIEWGLWCQQEQYPMPRAEVIPNIMAACQGQVGSSIVSVKDGSELKTLHALPKQIIAKDLVHEAILNPPISWYGNTLAASAVEDQFKQYTYPAEGCSEIHMIWSDSPSLMSCWNDSNSIAKAFQSPKIEFTLFQHPWFENDSLFADIILPSNTKFETRDIAIDPASGQFHTIMIEEKCIDPLGESMSDYEITLKIAEKLGVLDKYTQGKSPEDWMKLGYETSGLQHLVSWEELNKKLYYVVPTDPEWEKHRAGIIDFYEKPEENPLKTPSGKIEFYSQNLAKHFPNDVERPPVPHWIEKGESHDERLSSEKAKKYPLLIVSNHGRWRVHSQHDDISWTREIITCKVKGPDGYMYEPIWINPVDAGNRGIKEGDVVKVFNERGGVLVGAYLTERIMPGVVYVDHGARYDPLVPGELDRGGAVNTITPRMRTSKNATGMATSGFLVEVEKVNLDELRIKYPTAFNRPYDRASGLLFKRALEN
jgi:molybdopterin guanine dinucleotide-containing S/N-oxide reductase-like protein